MAIRQDNTGGSAAGLTASASSWGESAETAYNKILDLLLHGEAPAGGRLPENQLADLTGVSRTPVRQALNRLAAEGVVRLSRNRGAQVVNLTDDDARGLLDLRARFEPYATHLAVDHMTEEHLGRLAHLADQMERLIRSGEFNPVTLSRLNNEFHGTFIENCGNRYLGMALQSVMMPAMVARTFDRYTPESLERSMAHHAELIDAARVGDAEWAESVMRTHILAALHAYPSKAVPKKVSPDVWPTHADGESVAAARGPFRGEGARPAVHRPAPHPRSDDSAGSRRLASGRSGGASARPDVGH